MLLFFFRTSCASSPPGSAGLTDKQQRGLDYRIGWYVILATIPIGILGLLFRIRSAPPAATWLVATVLIVFAVVFWVAERWHQAKVDGAAHPARRPGDGVGAVPGADPGRVPLGATASAGLFLWPEREAAFRFSFLLAIPAVTASGLFSLPDAFSPSGEGMEASGPQLLVATLIAFVVGYASIAWLLQFVSKHSMNWFGGYRIILVSRSSSCSPPGPSPPPDRRPGAATKVGE